MFNNVKINMDNIKGNKRSHSDISKCRKAERLTIKSQ